MDDEPDAYQTYVLRLWRAKCQGKWQWHASIESPHTGERHAFASLEQLFADWSEQCERQVPDGWRRRAPDVGVGFGVGHQFSDPGAGERDGRKELSHTATSKLNWTEE